MLNRLMLICKSHPARFWPMLFCRSGQESPGPLLANAFLPIRTRITRPASGQCFSADPDKNHPARFWPMLFCRSGQESPGPLLANAFLPIRTGRESDPARLVGRNGSYVIHEAENSSDGFSPDITLRGG